MLVRLVCPFSSLLPLTHTDEIGNYYFVRFASLSLKDSTNPQYPYQAYSAKFTYVPSNNYPWQELINSLDQMDGSFNATILAAISSDPSAASASASKSVRPLLPVIQQN
jgi:hypothetical protein